MTSELRLDGASFDVFVGLAKRDAETPADPVVDRIGRARLVEHVARAPGRGRILTSTFGPVPKKAWLAVVAFVVGAFVWGLASRPVGFVVRGTTNSEPYIRVGDDRPVDVDFSDGTTIHAAAGARLRIAERHSRGARILIERGRATVGVARRVRAHWSFVAGPFEGSVKGATFVLSWDPGSEQLDVEIDEGALELDAPHGPRHVVVRAGQHLRANVAQRSLMLFESGAGSSNGEQALAEGPLGDGRAVLELTPSASAAPDPVRVPRRLKQ